MRSRALHFPYAPSIIAVDLTTTYLGLKLHTPLVPPASPLSEEIDNIKQMEDAGAAAIVLHSLFEEQMDYGRPAPEGEFRVGPDAYLENIAAGEAVGGNPDHRQSELHQH